MVKWFISHLWKEYTRSPNFGKSKGISILMGVLVFIMIIYLLALGVLMDRILTEAFPNQNPVVVFNGGLIFYFFADLLIRFFMQGLPKLNIESYLHLPIKKNAIVRFMVLRTLTSAFNFLPLFVIIPFTLISVTKLYGALPTLIWFIAILLMVWGNNFLATYLKRLLGSKPRIIGILSILYLAIFMLNYFSVIDINYISATFFGLFITEKVYLLIPLIYLIIAYYLHYAFLKQRLYPEEINTKKVRRVDAISKIKYFKSLGALGTMMALDLKMIWRHKRTRTIIYMTPVFLLYGFFFYPQDIYMNMTGMLIFVGVFMTGGLMINYNNYAFAYESGYFDALLANNIDFRMYLRMKYLNSVLLCSVCYIITIPYVYFGAEILLINTVAFLYNLGIVSIVLLYMATFNKKNMDLSKGAAFNYQGMNASNWLAMLPAFLMPVITYAPFYFIGYPTAGLLFIGIIGLLGLIFNKYLLEIVYKQFNKRRYIMSQGFRER